MNEISDKGKKTQSLIRSSAFKLSNAFYDRFLLDNLPLPDPSNPVWQQQCRKAKSCSIITSNKFKGQRIQRETDELVLIVIRGTLTKPKYPDSF